MCGIVGYIGKNKNIIDIVKTLKKLEYRGYDSSGILAVLDSGETLKVKKTGNISNLESAVPDKMCRVAIAHTRWATHGKPTEENAHPHSSCGGEWSVVHNGIIENYLALKQGLKNKPQSQTDTAVVAEVLEEKNAENILDFIDVMGLLDGSYAIVATSKKDKNSIFLARNKSPLYVSIDDDNNVLVASDPICFVGFSKTYYSLKNQEYAVAKNGTIDFYDKTKNQILKTKEVLGEDFELANKSHYKHFMLKEIMEEPEALKRLIRTYRDSGIINKFNHEFINSFNEVKFVGCGTAFNAGLVGARYFEKLTGKKAQAVVSSEFIYSEPVFADSKTLFVFVSQSGETADTLRAVEVAKQHNATTIALTNVLYSSLAKQTDFVLPVCAGPEIAVASTKAYVCQLAALYMLASKISNKHRDFFEDIEGVANKILNFDFKKIDGMAEGLKSKSDAIFIGKDIDYITAGEASLKLKEVGYINSAHYTSGELKHGYLALVEKGTPLIVCANNKKTNQKTFNAASEAVSRGAYEIVLTNEKIEENNSRKVIFFDEENELLLPLLTIVPLQYLAYKVSVLKNINPDQPRNLAKSVTVE